MPILKTFDKKFFKKWSADMSYILGFMYADGNMVLSKRGTHFVAIYTNDYSLLLEMRGKMRSDHKISTTVSPTGNCYRIQIGSIELFDDLSKLGLVINKASRMNLPNVPDKYLGDFVRGYFDGDGCVWTGIAHKNRRTQTKILLAVFTSCSNAFLRQLSQRLHSRKLGYGSLYKIKKVNCSRLQYSTHDALKLYRIMYNRETSLELTRKRVIFEKFMKLRA